MPRLIQLTGKVFADERVLCKHVLKHGCINDEWDAEGFAVGKWHTAAGAKALGVVDGRQTSSLPDAPAPVPFIPRVTAEISAAESAKEALATAYEEHIAAVAQDPSLAEKTELMLLRAQNAALQAENLRHREDNSQLRAVASSSHETTLALKLNAERACVFHVRELRRPAEVVAGAQLCANASAAHSQARRGCRRQRAVRFKPVQEHLWSLAVHLSLLPT